MIYIYGIYVYMHHEFIEMYLILEKNIDRLYYHI